MCGIAGILFPNPDTDRSVLKNMCDAIAHRGPDGEGYYYETTAHLGHRRLSIIDLSENAKQPMTDANNQFQIVFNGEIYNYKEIKEELVGKGYRFLNQSDTEVILNAYAEWGKDCLEKFNGMFAFLIWDIKEKKAFMARDRFGKKPFYYSILPNGTFIFASESNAILKHPEINKKINPVAVNHYLALGYILSPYTIYQNVYKLPAATYAFFSKNATQLQPVKYWNYLSFLSEPKLTDIIEIEEQIREQLLRSVKYRLIADVPVGCFLSGGIDSSSVVAAVRKVHNEKLHTFSIGFDKKSYNEIKEAKFAAQYFKTDHHDNLLNISGANEILTEAINAFDEPFADNSLIPMFKVSALASKYVKVVLSGDGADELFAGYITYKADSHYQKIKQVPVILRKTLFNVVKNKKISEKQKIGFQYKLRQFLQGAVSDYGTAHFSWRLIFPTEIRIEIMGQEYAELIRDTDPVHIFRNYFKESQHLHWLDSALYVDAMTWLTDDILVKVDRTTMKNGIEARAPYLDKNLVEYVARIHPRLKLKNGQTKWILKKALEPWLPKEILYRKKSGFNAPVGEWIGNTEGDEFRTFNKFVYNHKWNERTSKTK